MGYSDREAICRVSRMRRQNTRWAALVTAAVAAVPMVARAVVYSLDVNGTTAGYGATASGSFLWNGTNSYFSTDTASNGTTGTFVADLAQNPVSGGGDQLAIYSDTRITTVGDYSLVVSGSRWLQRADISPAGASATTATFTFSGTGVSPTINIVAQASGSSFIGISGSGASTGTFDAALTVNAYGPLSVFSGGTGRTLNINGVFNRFDRGMIQVNNGTFGTINIATSNTSVANTNGAVVNGLWITNEVNGLNPANFAMRGAGNNLTAITGQVGVTANLANVTSSTANYTANLNTGGLATVTGTANTATATYTFNVGSNLSANTLRLYNSGFTATSTTLNVSDSGSFTIDLGGNTLALNALLSIQQPLTITGTTGAQLKAGSANELTIMSARNVSLAVPFADNGFTSNLVLAGTRNSQTFTMSATGAYSGSTYIVSSTVSAASPAALGTGIAANGAEIVLNQGTLKTLTSGTYAQAVRTSATTVNVIDGLSNANALTFSKVSLDLNSRLTLQNGSFTIPNGVNFATSTNQLTVANGASANITGLTGAGAANFGTKTTLGFSASSLVSGASPLFTGSLQHFSGTVTYDGTFSAGVLTGFGQGGGTVNLLTSLTVKQPAFTDFISGDQSGLLVPTTLNIKPGGTLDIQGPTTGTARPAAFGNGSGSAATDVVNIDGTLTLDANVVEIGIGGNPFRTLLQTTGTINVKNGGLFSAAGAQTAKSIYLGVNAQTTGGAASSAVSGVQSGTVIVNSGGTFQTSRTITTGTIGTGSGAGLSSTFVLNGGTLQAYAGQDNTNWVTGLTKFSVTSSGGTIDTNGQSLVVNQTIVDDTVGGGGGLTKAGGGDLTLGGVNTFGGPVSINGGSLSVGANANLGGTTGLELVTVNGGALRLLASYGSTLGRNLVTGSGGGTLSVDSGAVTLTQTGTLTGPGDFYKAGAGALVTPSVNAVSTTFGGGYYIRNGTVAVGVGKTFNLPGNVEIGVSAGAGVPAILGAGASTLNFAGTGIWGSAASANIYVVGDQNTSSGNLLSLTAGSLTLKNAPWTPGSYNGLIIATANVGGQTVSGTVDVSGGTLTIDGGLLQIGGSGDTYTVSTGTSGIAKATGSLIVRGTSTVNILPSVGGIYLGQRSAAGVSAGVSANVTGNIFLQGGTLSTAAPIGRFTGNQIVGATGNLYFDGGVLQLNSSGTMVSAVNGIVRNGGAIFDAAAGVDALVTSALAPDSGSTGGVAKTGNGRITLSGSLSYTGNTFVEGGELVLAKPLNTPASTLSVSGIGSKASLATPALVSSNKIVATVANVAVADSGTVVLTQTDRSTKEQTVLVTYGLSIDNDGSPLGTRVYSGTVDVSNNDLIIIGGSLADATDMARSGQNGPGGLFTGTGITSTVAAADANNLLRFAVGVVQNNIDGATLFDTFDGVSVGLNDVLVKFTYFGDADLNGFVDDTDFFLINNGYGMTATGWVNGDFDYSGTVDDTDFFLINNAYGTQGPLLRSGNAVPEPTCMGLSAVAGGVLLCRRRK